VRIDDLNLETNGEFVVRKSFEAEENLKEVFNFFLERIEFSKAEIRYTSLISKTYMPSHYHCSYLNAKEIPNFIYLRNVSVMASTNTCK
jgi:hypothetical protein